jgi:hypothetical protein
LYWYTVCRLMHDIIAEMWRTEFQDAHLGSWKQG